MPFGRLILCSWCPFVRLLVPLCEAKTLFAGGFCKAVNCSRWPLMPVLVSKAVTTYLLAVNLCSARICPNNLKGHSNRTRGGDNNVDDGLGVSLAAPAPSLRHIEEEAVPQL